MGLPADDLTIDRTSHIRDVWQRVVPIMEQVNAGADWMEFYFHLLGRYRVIARYSEGLDSEGRYRLGVQLQSEGARALKLDVVQGAIECIIGTHLELSARPQPGLAEVLRDAQRLIDGALALYGSEDDPGA